MRVGLLLLVLVGCSAQPSGDRALSNKPLKGDEPAMTDARAAACADLACLEANEGKLVEVEGTFLFPRRKAFANLRLQLTGGTIVMLSIDDRSIRAKLTADVDGKRVIARGRSYTRSIPDEYEIIGRTSDPYLVDVADVVVAP